MHQAAFHDAFQKETGNKYKRIVTLNSGSEAVELALRISNSHQSRRRAALAIKDGFHGRTKDAATISDSSAANYKKVAPGMADGGRRLFTVPANDLGMLKEVVRDIDEGGYCLEVGAMEPIMGEGNPGLGMTPEFYTAFHDVVTERNGLMLVDSIQAGFRCHGVLSINQYPGFENAPSPDMETFSKAIHAGQMPLSVLAVNARAEERFMVGTYGNTLTGNPKVSVVGRCVAGVEEEHTVAAAAHPLPSSSPPPPRRRSRWARTCWRRWRRSARAWWPAGRC